MSSHCSLDTKRATCIAFKFAQNLRAQTGEKTIKPIELATAVAGGVSRVQVYAWLKQDLSSVAVAAKPESRGVRKMLNESQESLLVGYAISNRSSMEPVTLETLHQFCLNHFDVTPSISTLSRTMTEFGFSSQKAMTRSSRMVSTEVVDAALSSIEEIRSYGFPPDQVLFMDETGLWSNVRERKTYHYQNWCANLNSITLFEFGFFLPLFLVFLHPFSSSCPPPCLI